MKKEKRKTPLSATLGWRLEPQQIHAQTTRDPSFLASETLLL